MATITFTIKKEGTVTNTVEGVSGSSCDNLTFPINQKLGEVTSHTPTEEYHEEEEKKETIIEIE